jgi:hypothetical protein
LALPDRSYELNRLTNVAERLAAARFVEDGFDYGSQRRSLGGE